MENIGVQACVVNFGHCMENVGMKVCPVNCGTMGKNIVCGCMH
jgi:hypothetical protein